MLCQIIIFFLSLRKNQSKKHYNSFSESVGLILKKIDNSVKVMGVNKKNGIIFDSFQNGILKRNDTLFKCNNNEVSNIKDIKDLIEGVYFIKKIM